MYSSSFQAVVLAAGKGSRMPEITAEKPKCLLPIGNKPLVWYTLNKLEQLGFIDVILIVAEDQKSEIQTTLDKIDLGIKIEYFAINNEEFGTADSLRLIQDKLKSDVIVLSCDLVTNVNLMKVFDLYFKHNASACALFFNSSIEQVTVPGPKAKHKPERDLVAISDEHRLVFLASLSDFEGNVNLRQTNIKKYSRAKMYSNLVDSHVYILKNWVIKYLVHKTNISSIKGELLPHIIKKQPFKLKGVSPNNVSVVNTKDKNDIFQFAKEADLDIKIRKASSYNDHYGDLKPSYRDDTIRCFAYLATRDEYGVRVNTLPAYCAINTKVAKLWDSISPNKPLVSIDPKADVKSTQVDPNCIVWESSRLSEKTAYKSSTIGSNCEVQNYSRVFSSIVMNNVVIKENVVLEGCIVCNGAVIERGCKLKSCLVGSNHTVPEESTHTNEILVVTDRLMEF